VYDYKNEVLKTIDEINSVRTFFYLTDLSDNFTENFGIEQIFRYGQIIELVQDGAAAWDEANEAAAANDISDRGSRKDTGRYRKILADLKAHMISFIENMDIHEVYRFVNEFPFLIDKEALKALTV